MVSFRSLIPAGCTRRPDHPVKVIQLHIHVAAWTVLKAAAPRWRTGAVSDSHVVDGDVTLIVHADASLNNHLETRLLGEIGRSAMR